MGCQLGHAGSWDRRKNETASSIWWFCGRGQFTDGGVSGADPVPCGRNGTRNGPSTIRANGVEPVKLAILGDSLAAGYGLAPAQAFPSRLQAALKDKGRNVTVINHGVSGDTTAGGLERIDWMMADKPDIVLVELGGNDMLRALDPATTERNLDAIIGKLKQAGVTVWLAA